MNYRRYFVPDSIIFATIVTSKRRKILLDNISLLKKSINYTKQNYNFNIIAITVMPDHIHILFKPENINSYPFIIRNIKSYFSRNIDLSKIDNYSETKNNIKHKAKDIWQQRFYEHTVRDENDLNKHLDYIHYNSMKHYNISPKNWQYSSFKNFVNDGYYENDWCNTGDKYKISDINLE